jgi:tetratricopeptide (TPR) repeat protein
LAQDPPTGNNKIKIPVRKPGMVLKTKTPKLKVKTKSAITLVCRLCKNPISDTNALLTCKSCGKHLCSICENKIDKEEIYIDGDDKHKLKQEFPLCEECYKFNLDKQKEQINIHRRYKQLNDSLPESPEVWFSTAERFIGSDRFYLAAMCFNEVIKFEKEYTERIIENWKNTGLRLLSESRPVEAVQCFDEALILNENLEDIWLNRGKTLVTLGRIKESLASFNKVIELNDKNFEAYSYKGFLLAFKNDQDGFDKNIKIAMDLNPNSEIVWLNKTKAHLVLKQFKDALNSSEKALNIKPDNIEALMCKCEGLTNSSEYLSAVECSKKILEQNVDNVKAINCKAKAFLGLGKNKEALELFEEVLKRDPNGEIVDYNEILNNTIQAGGIERVKQELEFDLDIQQKKLGSDKPLTPEQTHLLELEREKQKKEERRRLLEEERQLLVEKERLEKQLANEEKEKQKIKDKEIEDIEEKEKEEQEQEPKQGEIHKTEKPRIKDEEPISTTPPQQEDAKNSVKQNVNELPTIDELEKLYQLMKDPELSAKIDQSELKTLIHENSKLIKSELQNLKSSGVIISNLIELYKKAGEKYKKENYLEAIEIIIEILKEKEKHEKEIFNDEINKLSTIISEMGSKLPIETFNEKLKEVKKALSENNLTNIRHEIDEIIKSIAIREKYYPKAKQLIENLEQKIGTIEKAGINVNEAKSFYDEMKQCLEGNDFQELSILKKRCLKSIEESRTKYKALLEDIKLAQNQNEQLKKNGIDDLECKHLLKKSKMMVIAGNYDVAKTLLSECIERSNDLIKK